jgi:hypothetical protein
MNMQSASFWKLDWDQRRQMLLSELISLVHQLDHGQIPHVSTDIHNIYVHFYRGKRELGDLSLGDALHGLNEDIYRWIECGKETRSGRGELDLKEANGIKLQTH